MANLNNPFALHVAENVEENVNVADTDALSSFNGVKETQVVVNVAKHSSVDQVMHSVDQRLEVRNLFYHICHLV